MGREREKRERGRKKKEEKKEEAIEGKKKPKHESGLLGELIRFWVCKGQTGEPRNQDDKQESGKRQTTCEGIHRLGHDSLYVQFSILGRLL